MVLLSVCDGVEMFLIVGLLDINIGDCLLVEEFVGMCLFGRCAYLLNVGVAFVARRIGVVSRMIECVFIIVRDEYVVYMLYVYV